MEQKEMLGKMPATLIPGDGIGPEISEAVTRIFDALGSPFEWDLQQGGMAGVQSAGDPLPGALIDSIRRTKLALKGPLTTPVGGGFRSVNVRLREEFGLYANLRPVKTMVPGGRYEDIDLVLIRENIEGLYVAFEHFIPVGDDPHAVAILRDKYPCGMPPHNPFRVRICAQPWPQEGNRGAQGECAESPDRAVSAGRPRDCRGV
jgi:isocitrate dehydrogenase (NAD+)